MYDRAERTFTFQQNLGTDSNVGPGLYTVRDVICDHYEIGYAPFNSLDERKFDFSLPDANNLPAPWDYEPEASTQIVKGCSSLANKAVRFPPFKSFGPAPNAYSITSTWGGKKPDPCGLLIPDVLLKAARGQDPSEQKRALCDQIAYVRYRDVPSIPSGRFANGYQEGPDGRLCPQSGPFRDDTLGPAYYGPTKLPTFTRYKGCCWSKHTSHREPLHKAVHKVGPGQYDAHTDYWEKLVYSAKERDAIQAHRPLNVPRFIEKVIREVQKQKFPSPAAYTIQDGAIRNVTRRDPKGGIIQGAPFNVEEKRFKEEDSGVPAPNSYTPRLLGCVRRYSKNVDKTPFNISASRFRDIIENTPAPNAYRPQNDLSHQLNKKIQMSDRPVAFGTTSKRITEEISHKVKPSRITSVIETTPGPAHYKSEKYDQIGAESRKGPGLGSSKRELMNMQTAAPAPGTYNVAQSFELSQKKHNFAPPTTKEGRARQSKFLFSAERFGKWSSLAPKEPDLPGPSDYCIPTALNERTGKFVYQSDRFKEEKGEDIPGPADYEIAPAVQSCLRIDTFNVTLPGKTVAAPLALRRS